MNIKLICDSMCDIPEEIEKKEYLEIIPLTLIVDGKEFVDNEDMTKDEFYKFMLEAKDIPKTSQATYVQFKEAFDSALEDGKDVICITGASNKSGTYQSAMLAKNDTEGRIEIIDSENLSIGSGQLVIRACDFIEEGLSTDEVVSKIKEVRESSFILFTPASFDFLKKSGRVPLTTAIIGNMLNIRPIFSMHSGEIQLEAKVRGAKKAFSKLVDTLISKYPEELSELTITIGEAGNREDFIKLKEEVEAKLKDKVKRIMFFKGGACICAHTGPDIVAIGFSK